MAGAQIKLDAKDLGVLHAELARLSRLDLEALRQSLAFAGETQTRRRLSIEKENPEGQAWPEWSEHYAARRHGGHRLLENEGDLIDSIVSGVDGEAAYWGSDRIYAATHQYGDEDRNIPQRAYLGLSTENQGEMVALINHFLHGAFHA